MSEIEELAYKIAEAVRPAIPLDVDLWDVKTIASYLKRDPAVVRERICSLPTFPAAIRIPNANGQRMHPLWKASDVVAWAESYKEKKTGI
jgi:hypothetical protein